MSHASAEASRHAIRAQVTADRISAALQHALAPQVHAMLRPFVAAIREADSVSAMRSAILRTAKHHGVPPEITKTIRIHLDRSLRTGVESAEAEIT